MEVIDQEDGDPVLDARDDEEDRREAQQHAHVHLGAPQLAEHGAHAELGVTAVRAVAVRAAALAAHVRATRLADARAGGLCGRAGRVRFAPPRARERQRLRAHLEHGLRHGADGEAERNEETALQHKGQTPAGDERVVGVEEGGDEAADQVAEEDPERHARLQDGQAPRLVRRAGGAVHPDGEEDERKRLRDTDERARGEQRPRAGREAKGEAR